MKLALSLGCLGSLVVLGSATAQADAPGEVAPVIIVAPAVPVAPRPSVMMNRWAVGLSFGSESLAPANSTDSSQQTQFAIGELAIRYRATLHFEVEVSAGGGREQLANGGGQGDLQLSTYNLGARYRFRPEQPWNWYLMAAGGATAVTSAEASHSEMHDAQRQHVQLGVGLERRFARFALAAELRAVAVIGDSTDASSTTAMPATSTTTPPTTTSSTSANQSGGVLTIGASYYF